MRIIVKFFLLCFCFIGNGMLGAQTKSNQAIDTTKVFNWLAEINQNLKNKKAISLKIKTVLYKDKNQSIVEETTTGYYLQANKSTIQSTAGQLSITNNSTQIVIDSTDKVISVLDNLDENYFSNAIPDLKNYFRQAKNISLSENNNNLLFEFGLNSDIKSIRFEKSKNKILEKITIHFNPQGLDEDGQLVMYEPVMIIDLIEMSKKETTPFLTIKQEDFVSIDPNGNVKSILPDFKVQDQRISQRKK